MGQSLDRTARRIIGVLIEKQLCTPNLYPLTLNALVNGCNQKSNRNPVLILQEFEVEGALRNLYVKEWATNMTGPGSRVLKWKHRACDRLGLNDEQLPIMGELLLRGAQTAGELRARVARMRDYKNGSDIDRVVSQLQELGLVRVLPPEAGRRAKLLDHTLYLDDEKEASPTLSAPPSLVDKVPEKVATVDLEALQDELKHLKQRVARMEEALGMNDPQEDDGPQEQS